MPSTKAGASAARRAILVVAAALATLPLPAIADSECGGAGPDVRVVRVAVIGGMTREVDLWPTVAQRFEEKTGYRVELTATGTVEAIAEAFAAGAADLLVMHSSDTTTNLVADGYGNKTWFVKDASNSEGQQLVYTASLGNAYCLFGRVPVVTRKVNTGGLQIMVEGDQAMQRPFVVMEANPQRFPCANSVGARKLAAYLLSKEIQELLLQFRVDEFLGLPPFYPLRNGAFAS